jgi:hypothetical protein
MTREERREFEKGFWTEPLVPLVEAPAAPSAKSLTYHGADWYTTLDRNVTVALEFAAHDLESEPPNVERALALVREAFHECRRVMREASHV